MLTLREYQNKEEKDQARWEELQKTIPDLAEDKFNALPVLYTKPEDRYQSAWIEDAVQNMNNAEWVAIARTLRDLDTVHAGILINIALRRVCLEEAKDEVQALYDKLNETSVHRNAC